MMHCSIVALRASFMQIFSAISWHGGGVGWGREGGRGMERWGSRRETQKLILHLFRARGFNFTISAFRFSFESFDIPSALQGALIINDSHVISRFQKHSTFTHIATKLQNIVQVVSFK